MPHSGGPGVLLERQILLLLLRLEQESILPQILAENLCTAEEKKRVKNQTLSKSNVDCCQAVFQYVLMVYFYAIQTIVYATLYSVKAAYNL